MSFDILKWLDDAPIKLTSGVGDPETGGCWMAAISVYSGASWGEHPPCVDPIAIRCLCVVCNDLFSSDEARGDAIGPHLLAPVGTATTDAAVNEQRRWHLVDAAVRRFAPYALRAAGLVTEAERLEALPRVTAVTAAVAGGTARAAATAATYAEAYPAAESASHAACAADRASDTSVATYSAGSAAVAAASPRVAADAAVDHFAASVLLPVILELCAIGSKAPVEPSCDELALRHAVQCA